MLRVTWRVQGHAIYKFVISGYFEGNKPDHEKLVTRAFGGTRDINTPLTKGGIWDIPHSAVGKWHFFTF